MINKRNTSTLEISPELTPVFQFLIEINEEVSYIISNVPEKYIRSKFICIFSYIEVLRCITTAYENETSDDKELRNASEDKMDAFIKKYLLAKNNPWVIKNKQKAKELRKSKRIVYLRNSLVHFYSLNSESKVLLVNKYSIKKDPLIIDTLKRAGEDYSMLSVDDFFEMVCGAGRLIINYWNTENKVDSSRFTKRIKKVIEVISTNGAVSIVH